MFRIGRVINKRETISAVKIDGISGIVIILLNTISVIAAHFFRLFAAVSPNIPLTIPKMPVTTIYAAKKTITSHIAPPIIKENAPNGQSAVLVRLSLKDLLSRNISNPPIIISIPHTIVIIDVTLRAFVLMAILLCSLFDFWIPLKIRKFSYE